MTPQIRRTHIHDAEEAFPGPELVWMGVPDVTPVTSYELKRRARLFRDDVIHFEESTGVTPTVSELQFPLLRLHCPNSPASRAREMIARSATSDIRMEFSLPGITGANKFDLELSVDSGWETSDGKCIEVVVPVRVRFAFGQYFLNKQPFALGFNLYVESVASSSVTQREISHEDDHCQLAGDASSGYRPISPTTRVLSGVNTIAMKTKSTVSGTRDVGVEIFGGRVNLAVGFERTSTVEHTVEYDLAPGYQYTAYAYDALDVSSAIEIVWRATPLDL